jgi:hypothetical protein
MSQKSRFTLRHAIVGYSVALVFALNGLLASVVDTSLAAGGNSFAVVTCLGGEAPGSLPGQSDHAAKCSCSLSCCCAGGAQARNSSDTEVLYSAAKTALHHAVRTAMVRDSRADRLLHLRSPPAALAPA